MDTKTIFFHLLFIQITQENIVRKKRDGAKKVKPIFTEGLFKEDIKGIIHDANENLVKWSSAIHLIAVSPRTNVAQGEPAVRDPFAVWLWPNGELFYEITNDFTQDEKKVIKDSLETFHKKTCIKMIRRTNQPDYITVRKLGEGECWSAVGRVGGAQELSLGIGCINHSIVIHEFMHALGFFHEQSRLDREKYIMIHKENILKDQDGNFKKYELDTLKDLKTDYEIVSYKMHYQKDTSSKNNLPTITPLQNVEIGDQFTLSEIDIIKLKRMYNCEQTDPPPLPIPPVGPTSSEIIQSGIRLAGHYDQYKVKDAEECKQKCEQQFVCSGMTFDSSDTYSFANCFLMKAGYTTLNDKSWSAWTKSEGQPDSIHLGVHLHGHYTQYKVNNAEECKKHCETDNQCYGMTFDSSNSHPLYNCFLCWAKYTIADNKPWSSWMKGKIQPGVHFAGEKAYRTISTVKTVIGCILICQQEFHCRAVNYLDGNNDTDVYGTCFLYDAKTGHSVGDNAKIDKWIAWVKGQS